MAVALPLEVIAHKTTCKRGLFRGFEGCRRFRVFVERFGVFRGLGV